MKRKFLYWGCLVSLLAFCIMGCAGTDDAMYTWENFSYAQYKTQKSPGEKSNQAYQEVLEEIIKQSENRGQRVPPGIYASLGWLYARQNAPTQALDCFTKEKQTYPEATVFMDQLIKQATLREEALDTTDEPNQPALKETPLVESTNKEAK